MNSELEALKKRVQRLERQNRFLKWIGLALVALGTATAVSGQKSENAVLQGQKFELRDSTGQLRADLAMLNGQPVLSFYDKNGNNQSFVDGNQYTILRKGGGEADIQATFGGEGLSFEGEQNKVYVSLRADEEEQSGKLQLNDYRHKTYAAITPAELSRLRGDKAK